MRLASFAGLMCFFAPTAIVFGQGVRGATQAESVPMPLATALAAAGGLGGDPKILVGSFPPRLRDAIRLPDHVTVLGSAFNDSSVVGVVELPDAPGVAVTKFSREFLKVGWISVPPSLYGESDRGSPGPGSRALASNGVQALCREHQMLVITALRRRGTTAVTIRSISSKRVDCQEASQAAARLSDSKLASFVADVQANDAGGECTRMPAVKYLERRVTVFYPTRAAPAMYASITFDSSGHLARYSEVRGAKLLQPVSGLSAKQQRDSAARAASAARVTTINLNYATDEATLMNEGGRKPMIAVSASARSVQQDSRFGISGRVARMRKLCGV